MGQCTVPVIGQPSLTPTTLPKNGTQEGGGGGGVEIEKFIGGRISLPPKIMTLQGVKYPTAHVAVCYVKTPENGVYVALTPTLDLTTLFKVISHTLK